MTWIVDEAVDWMDASVGCLPGRIGRLFRRLYWGLRLGSLGAGASIGRAFSASGAGRIKIGGGFCSTGRGFLAAEGGSIRMGDHVALNQNVHINASIGGSIDIGNHVMIGPNCVLRASDHRSERLDMPMQRQGHSGGTIVIEDDVWLGANVVVVAGVRIGRGCVVAAGAVVTKDVEPESVVGGVPARLIRMRGRETAVGPDHF